MPMNRRSFLALCSAPLVAALAACKSPLPFCSEGQVRSLRSGWFLVGENWTVRAKSLGAVPDPWPTRDSAAPLSPEDYPEMRKLLGPDLTLDDDGFLALKEIP